MSDGASGRSIPRRKALGRLALGGLTCATIGCGSGEAAMPPRSNPGKRSWRMGFSPNPPRFTVEDVLKGIGIWSQRAELVIIHEELPWADLLRGMSAEEVLNRDKVQLVQFLRGKGLGLHFMLDLTNGLAREEEAPALVKAGRSLGDPVVQALARDYALAVERMLAPEWLGLAVETNLIREIAPAPIYQAVKATAALIEAALASSGARARRFVSIQAESAWGRLVMSNKGYLGVAQDLTDFAFTQALGISSYPYLGWGRPDDLPADYYSRLRGKSNLPVIVTEGGWASASFGPVVSSPENQARYIERHADLLDGVQALAWFQLQFADLDLDTFPAPIPPSLPLFGSIGLADPQFKGKPALKAWDVLFRRMVTMR
ncbi:hypothetical protein [Novosphingobium sp.]|uniref:hypothetical protein n=1 Tax=Novosphingobium sp. TaxID=1874826 RepID=UPI0025D4469A|nr:hypothetical protein [Novosphingobium sp.]MCC6925426.1 hypothetical protein [Novosphingobium sp.]